MWIKSYIEYKTKELIECKLLFKHGKIQEFEMDFFSGIKPFENNSELADNIEILKTYKQDESNKFCKYFIKKSVNKEVLKMFLDINYIQYLKLQWQLKHFLIQSKDIKIELLKYVIFGIIGYLIANFQSKNPPNQSPNNKDNTEQTKSNALNNADKKIDSLIITK